MAIAIVGIDLGKNVCNIAKVDKIGTVLRRRRVRRDKLVTRCDEHSLLTVAMV